MDTVDSEEAKLSRVASAVLSIAEMYRTSSAATLRERDVFEPFGGRGRFGVGSGAEPEREDSFIMLAKMASLAGVKLQTPGRMAESEFRFLARVFGFGPSDADHIFAHLDSTSGYGAGHILPSDLEWLIRLPKMAHLGGGLPCFSLGLW